MNHPHDTARLTQGQRPALAALILALIVTLAPSNAFADAIVIMSDTNLSRCEVVDAGPGTFEAYVFHIFGQGYLGSGFRIGASAGFTGVFQSVQYPIDIFSIGDIAAEGVGLGYYFCTSEQYKLVATLTYATFGTSENCSSLMVLPLAESGIVEIYRCSGDVEPATAAGSLVVNPAGGCRDACQTGVPTRETTWGAVKALYR